MANQQAVSKGVFKARGDFFKNILDSIRALADKPNRHQDVARFITSLVELERTGGWSFEDIGTSRKELKDILLAAFAKTKNYLGETASGYEKVREEEAAVLKIFNDQAAAV